MKGETNEKKKKKEERIKIREIMRIVEMLLVLMGGCLGRSSTFSALIEPIYSMVSPRAIVYV